MAKSEILTLIHTHANPSRQMVYFSATNNICVCMYGIDKKRHTLENTLISIYFVMTQHFKNIFAPYEFWLYIISFNKNLFISLHNGTSVI